MSEADVQCSQNIADPRLWSAVVDWYDHGEEHYSFPDYCEISCECLTETEAQAEYRGDIDWYDENDENLINMTGVLPNDASNISADGQSTASDDTMASRSHNTTTSGQSASNTQMGKDPPNRDAHAPTVVHDQCGNNCSSNQDCFTGGNQSCTCSTQSEQYQPGTATVAFLAACVISLSGKRDEGRPCPCNATYVSHACCGTEDGLVWEAAGFKLGEILMQEEDSVQRGSLIRRPSTNPQ